ncbi:MAG: energy transducer TonB [Bacteroidota bacterium]|nr:energy transducer TonB [Bacteroidota bacterium]
MNKYFFTIAFILVAFICKAQMQAKDTTLVIKVRKPTEANTLKESNSVVVSDVVENETLVFSIVEQMPVFPGGEEAIVSFLKENIKYPVEAKKANDQGTVFLSFIIDSAGNVTYTRIIRSSGNTFLDNEALRVVNSMPSWRPGKQRGVEVPVYINLPVVFKLK